MHTPTLTRNFTLRDPTICNADHTANNKGGAKATHPYPALF
ncbi:hypothetical protein ATPR_1296 [Acetobacter orientalis]|uniref:Uncharacterized protein n=1 Tax=Acetobacter orientalis TaxID=146474 RepID=A0A2Z5ZKP2_9PROT|nr:hypothetical protein ATPR_1296 [Acetobacter orientalis]